MEQIARLVGHTTSGWEAGNRPEGTGGGPRSPDTSRLTWEDTASVARRDGLLPQPRPREGRDRGQRTV
jgi:hypothetical protein